MAIRNAGLVVVIGAAARRYDAHIWEPLQTATGRILYIGSERDVSAWRECNPRFEHIGSTFDRGFRRLLRRLASHKRRMGGSFCSYILDTCRAWFV